MKQKEIIHSAIANVLTGEAVAKTVNILNSGTGSIHLCLGDSRLVEHESNLQQRIHFNLQADDDRTVIALPLIIEETAKNLGANNVLLDLNPSYSAINRLIYISHLGLFTGPVII